MARNKKDGRIFNCYLRSEIYDLLDKYSIKTGLTKTLVTERAIEQFLRRVSAKEEDEKENVGG